MSPIAFRAGISIKKSELIHILKAIDSNYEAQATPLMFDDFVNGFSSINEWDRLFDIYRQRKEQRISAPALPLLLLVPALHRKHLLEDVMKNKSDEGILHDKALREQYLRSMKKAKQAKEARETNGSRTNSVDSDETDGDTVSLLSQWRQVQVQVRKKHAVRETKRG